VASNLRGARLVKAIRPAFQDAHRLCPRLRDRAELRRATLKLRFWPAHHPADERGVVVDVDWEWIKALAGLRIGELRIGFTIAGNDNLRVIFYVGDPKINKPLPRIWVLAVIQKKRQDFSSANLKAFRARRLLVVERFERAP
jgi:hypothetical protein